MKHAFLKEWRDGKPDRSPFVFDGDKRQILSLPEQCKTCFNSPEEYIESKQFNDVDDTCLHLGLHPQPMLGDLARAKVIFLLLNPGLKPGDYFAEHDRGQFWKAIRQSTRQEVRTAEYPFAFLDPRFSWHSGFLWWTKKLRDIIAEAQKKYPGPPKVALRRVSGWVASIELYPYHSRKFKLPNRTRAALRSAELARLFVHDVLLPKAKRGNALIVVMRQAKTWGLAPQNGVVMFDNLEARGAHLTSRTKGRIVLDFLGLR